MNNEELKELLMKSLENVNAWLYFIETKNAALIAFNIALLAALFGHSMSNLDRVLFSCIVIGLLISIGISLFSFKPINKSIRKIKSVGVNANLLHYTYIASLERDDYLKEMYRRYCGEANKDINLVPDIEKDYSEEIIQNSRITVKKQTYFKNAFYVDIFIIFAIAIMIICA